MATWTCPYCRQKAAVGTGCSRTTKSLRLPDGDEAVLIATACLNPDCRQIELIANHYAWESIAAVTGVPGEQRDKLLASWKLIPQSRARVWPDYVPEAIRTDYAEACKIEALSPQASAAFSRRCLRAIIHDFYGVSERRLVDEIETLMGNVEEGVSESLHALRSIPNIAAHAERDPDVIGDIEPGEASAMIDLLELLIAETYVASARRFATRARVAKIANETTKAPDRKALP